MKRRPLENPSVERNEGVLDPHHLQNQGTDVGGSVIPKVVEMIVKKTGEDRDLDHALHHPTAAVATHEIVNGPAKSTKRRANPSIDPRAAKEVKRKTAIIANAARIRKRRASIIDHPPKTNILIIPLLHQAVGMVRMSNEVSLREKRLRCILIRLQMIWYGRRLGRIC